MSFRIASKQALKSGFRQHRMGAVIVKGSRIMSTGYNALRPSSVTKTPTLHAEAAAILKLLKEKRLSDLSGAELYVTRFTPTGRVGLSRPCMACRNLCASVGIRKVHYTTNDGTTETLRIDESFD